MNKTAWTTFAALVLAVGLYTHFVREDDAKRLLTEFPLDQRWMTIASSTVKTLVKGTLLGMKTRLNEPDLAADELGIYVIDSRAPGSIPAEIKSSCGMSPAQRRVICDVRFIDDFLSERDLDKQQMSWAGDQPIGFRPPLQPTEPADLDSQRAFLLTWVLGHELGHYALGHSASHFAPSPLDEKVQATSLSQEQELAADAYLASIFDYHSQSGNDFYLSLVHLLNIEVHKRVCPELSPLHFCDKIQFGAGIFAPNVELFFSSDDTHPEYLIRVIRLIKEGHEKYDLGPIGYQNDQIVAFLKRELD